MTGLYGRVGLPSPPEKATAMSGQLGGNAAPDEREDAYRYCGPFCELVAFGDGVERYQNGGASVVLAGRPRWNDDGSSPASGGLAQRVLDGYRSKVSMSCDDLAAHLYWH